MITDVEGMKAKFCGGVPTVIDTPLAMALEAPFATVTFEIGTETGIGIHSDTDAMENDGHAKKVNRLMATADAGDFGRGMECYVFYLYGR